MKLLDGQEYNKKELIDNMYSDEFYYNELNLNKALSYSSLKWLLKSPKWFEYMKRNPQKETQALRDGRLIHTEILEPQKYQTMQFVDVSSKNTKKWKLAVQEFGKAYTYTYKEKYMNNRIATAFLQNDACTSYLKGSETEVPALELFNNIPVRGKADILGADFVADVKTTADGVKDINTASGQIINQFAYTVKKYDYDLQAYLYTKLFNVPRFIWLVVDKTTTDIGIFEASPETLESGKLKLEACLQLYNAFFIDELIDLSQYHKQGLI